MKLIIERDHSDNIFAYFENEKHHKEIERQKENRISSRKLNEECDLYKTLNRGQYIVINVSRGHNL